MGIQHQRKYRHKWCKCEVARRSQVMTSAICAFTICHFCHLRFAFAPCEVCPLRGSLRANWQWTKLDSGVATLRSAGRAGRKVNYTWNILELCVKYVIYVEQDRTRMKSYPQYCRIQNDLYSIPKGLQTWKCLKMFEEIFRELQSFESWSIHSFAQALWPVPGFLEIWIGVYICTGSMACARLPRNLDGSVWLGSTGRVRLGAKVFVRLRWSHTVRVHGPQSPDDSRQLKTSRNRKLLRKNGWNFKQIAGISLIPQAWRLWIWGGQCRMNKDSETIDLVHSVHCTSLDRNKVDKPELES